MHSDHAPLLQESTPSGRPRFLLVAQANFLASARSGGGQRTLALLHALAAEGEVDVIAFARPGPDQLPAAAEAALPARMVQRVELPQSSATERLRERLRLLALGWFGRSMTGVLGATPLERAVRTLHAERRYDLMAFRYALAFAHCGPIAGVPTFIDNDDPISERGRSAARGQRGVRRVLAHARASAIERGYRRLLSRATCVVAVKAEDLHLSGAPISALLPNVAFVVPASMAPPPRGARPTGVFIGTLDYPPNRQAVDRLVSAIWPRVRAAIPEAELRIVGTRAAPQDRERWASAAGVVVVGEVASILDAYASSWIALNPIESGSGSNIKVAEAMLLARPVVSSTFGVRGWEAALGAEHGLLSAADDAGVADHCIELLASPQRTASLGEAARRWASDHASPEAFAAMARGLLRDTVAHRSKQRRG